MTYVAYYVSLLLFFSSKKYLTIVFKQLSIKNSIDAVQS